MLAGVEVVLELWVWWCVVFLAFCEVFEVEFCEDFFGNWDGLWWEWGCVRLVRTGGGCCSRSRGGVEGDGGGGWEQGAWVCEWV